jgi:hypothetical protein
VNGALETSLVLRAARGQNQQQVAIDCWLRERQAAGDAAGLAVLAEGAFFELRVPPEVALERLTAGCVCCIGLLPLQVTLTRLLRKRRPRVVLLLVADALHFDRVRALVASGKLGVRLEEIG